MSSRWVVGLLVVRVATAGAGPASFKPPTHMPDAQAHFEHGTSLFDTHDFLGAADEYAAAYGIDHDAKWLLLDIAIARRKADQCPQAIDAYKAFLAENPPNDVADRARAGEAECAQILLEKQREQDVAAARADAERLQRDQDAERARARDAAAREAARAREVAALVETRARIGRRAVVIGGAGVVTGLVAGSLYLYARHDASTTFSATTTTSYASARTDTYDLRDASEITAGVAVAIVAAATAYYIFARPAPAQTIAIEPTHTGALLVVAGVL